MRKLCKKLSAVFLVFVLTATTMLTAYADVHTTADSSGITITTTLEDGSVQKGSKKTFDVWAKDASGNKITSAATLNGAKIPVKWDDNEKTSFALVFKKEGDNIIVVSASDGGDTASVTYHITYEKASPGDVIGYCTWSIEAFTIGNGYIVEPVKVPVIEGENSAKMLDKLIKNAGYTYSKTGNLNNSFYFAAIKNGSKKLNITNHIPQVLVDHIKSKVREPKPNSLGEFDFTSLSGWMYCVNGVFPNVGFADTYLSDGDVVRTQFTLALGCDIGGGWSECYFDAVNKDHLTELLAKFNSSRNKNKLLKMEEVRSAYSKAMDTVKQVDADQGALDDAYYTLYDAMGLKPLDGISLSKTELTLSKGSTETLKIIYDPKNTDDDKTATWTSSDSNIAKVENGKVTGKDEGTATITATVGDFTASCDITVKPSERSAGGSQTGSGSAEATDNSPVTVSDPNTNVIISAPAGVIPKDTRFVVIPITETDQDTYPSVNTALKNIAQKQTVYDLSLTNNGVKIEPSEKVSVRLPIPDGYDRNNLAVVWIKPDGTFENLSCTIDGNFVAFQTNHFSLYSIIEKSSAADLSAETVITAAQTSQDASPASGSAKKNEASTTGALSSPKTGGQSEIPVTVILICTAAVFAFSVYKRSYMNKGTM